MTEPLPGRCRGRSAQPADVWFPGQTAEAFTTMSMPPKRGSTDATGSCRWPQCDTPPVTDRNVLGTDLEPCSTDPLTGFYRDGCCTSGPEDIGSHTVCAVVTREFLDHQRQVGNDLSTPMPQYRFAGLQPGDRWCVVAVRWLQAYRDGMAAPVVLAATNERALDIVALEVLREFAVDVPADPGSLD